MSPHPPGIDRWMVAVSTAAGLILIVVASVAFKTLRLQQESSDWVNHTHALIMESQSITASLHAGESALRSYLISGDARDQTAYRDAYARMLEHYEITQALARQEAAQSNAVLQLAPLLQQRLELARSLALNRATNTFEAVRSVIADDAGGEVVRQIERWAVRFAEDQKSLLQARDRAAVLRTQTTRWTIISGMGLNVLLMGLLLWVVRDDLASRRRLQVALEEANTSLESKVAQRTSELAQTNRDLHLENLERRWKNEALEHQLRYSHLVIDSIGEPVFVITRNLHIVRANPAALRLLNKPASEIISLPVNSILTLSPNDAAADTSARSWDKVLREGRDLTGQPATLNTPTEHLQHLLIHAYPVRDADKVVGAVIVTQIPPTL